MAKVIRNCYVYRRDNRWHQYLPRRNDKNPEYDLKKNNAMPENFNQPMEVDQPPKLWLVWVYRNTYHERKSVKNRLEQLFGTVPEPGKMHVLKNTADINDHLWRVKHLIELRPVSFPNGEPTSKDVGFTELFTDGRCVVDKEANADHNSIELYDGYSQFKPGYLSDFMNKRDRRYKDVYVDNVYNPANITVVD